MLYIIANELAGSGAGAETLRRVKALLEERRIPYECRVTEWAGHATELAREAADSGKTEIVSLGGDGTNFEIVNGLGGRFAKLYFVPCGTGNDFVRMLNLPRDPVDAFRAQLDGKPRRIDIGEVNEFHFLNVSGCGFDADVLRQADRFKKRGKGLLPYLLGIFAALKSFRPMTVEWTENGQTVKKDVTIYTLGNGSYFGGGMKAVPHAVIDDGKFDRIIADAMGRGTILRMLSKFIPGKHTSLPQVREDRCTEVTLRCSGMTVNIDGELFRMNEARYRIIPGAIEISLPA